MVIGVNKLGNNLPNAPTFHNRTMLLHGNGKRSSGANPTTADRYGVGSRKAIKAGSGDKGRRNGQSGRGNNGEAMARQSKPREGNRREQGRWQRVAFAGSVVITQQGLLAVPSHKAVM